MTRKQTKDLLIRNVPIELCVRLERAAKEHNRSKTQQAIVALAAGLSIGSHQVKQPKPFKWKTKISDDFIDQAIEEGREE